MRGERRGYWGMAFHQLDELELRNFYERFDKDITTRCSPCKNT